MNEKNETAAKYGGLIYTTGLNKGIPIGRLQENGGNKVLVVKDHKRTDYIMVDDLLHILCEYQNI